MNKRKISNEEIQFTAWCREAKTAGLIESFACQPKTYGLIGKQTRVETVKLKTKTKEKMRHVFRDHKYTADFKICLTDKGRGVLGMLFPESLLYVDSRELVIDTKGGYTVQHGQSQMFSCNRKLMYLIYGIYVEKVVPCELFKKTWCPESCRWMRGRKLPTLNKLGAACRTVGEFLEVTK